MIRVYHICEICQKIFDSSEVEGPEGTIGLQGICEDCAAELGFSDDFPLSSYHYYH